MHEIPRVLASTSVAMFHGLAIYPDPPPLGPNDLLPILIVLVVVGALALLGTTSAAPFIYTLF